MKRIAFPTVLALFLSCPLHAETLPPADWYATVAEMSGLLRSQTPPAAAYRGVTVGQRLNPGDTILTLAGGRARLEFSDGSRTWLAANTRLEINRPEAHRRSLTLLRGFVRLMVAKVSGDEAFGVTTPTAIAAVKGTEFTLGVSDAVTDIAVLEGQVLCSDRARRYAVLMRAGEAARWERNGLWQPVRRLGLEEREALRTADTAPETGSPPGTGPSQEPAAEAGAGAPPIPSGLRLGGYVVGGYHLLGGGRGLSQPWLGLSPFTREVRSTFDNPGLSLTADSPLGSRAHTFWELWATGGGRNQFNGPGHMDGRLDLLQGWAEVDLLAPDGRVPLATLRAGILPVPVGVLGADAALPRRVFTSYPLYAIRQVPVPWADAGAQVSGGVQAGPLVLRYSAALINGLQIEPFDGWQAPGLNADGLWWARPGEDERSLGRDNNMNKAAAGRVGIAWGTGSGLGVSGYRGKADATNTMGIQIGAADATVALDFAAAQIRLRAEGGQVALTRGPAGLFPSWPERGGYGELEVVPGHGPVSLGAGASRVGARAAGGAHLTELYAAVAFRVVPQMVFKLEGQQYTASAGGTPVTVLAAQVAAFW